MLNEFNEFISRHGLHRQGDRVLLAVSGGLDSVVMTHLYHEAGYACAVTHCNFSLRDVESDEDERFVKELANRYNFPFHTRKFDTVSFAHDNGISLQMAARRLRYAWFHELLDAHGYASVATGHHADDAAETMLLNLARGTGLAGMHGIAKMRGRVVRPLLFATRRRLEAYAAERMLTWREDSTNAETTYLRNRIRHQVMPVLRDINPSVTEAFSRHALIMEGYEKLVAATIDSIRNAMGWRQGKNGELSCSLDPVMNSPAPEVVLYSVLEHYGVVPSMCAAILDMKSGGEIHTAGWRLVRDRNGLALFPKGMPEQETQLWYNDGSTVQLAHGWLSREHVITPQVEGNFSGLPGFGDPDFGYFDAAQLQFPLEVRGWRHGDTFQPLGLLGSKLVSDFITNEKMDAVTKEHVTLLVSGGKIAWVIGHRIDDRFRITPHTRNICLIRYHHAAAV
jgi:tRNA(Ile)-lysidine synthase